MNACTIVYLIRHGEVINPLQLVYGRMRDVHLNEEGYKQVKETALFVHELTDSISAFFVSPRNRTKETTQIFLELFPNTPIFYRDELQEVASSRVVGRSLEWFRSIGDVYDEAVQQRYGYTVESGELQGKRMCHVISEVIQMFVGKTIAVVSHGHPLAFAMETLLHPNAVRSIEVLKAEHYLLRGQAWRLIFSLEGKLQEFETV